MGHGDWNFLKKKQLKIRRGKPFLKKKQLKIRRDKPDFTMDPRARGIEA